MLKDVELLRDGLIWGALNPWDHPKMENHIDKVQKVMDRLEIEDVNLARYLALKELEKMAKLRDDG